MADLGPAGRYEAHNGLSEGQELTPALEAELRRELVRAWLAGYAQAVDEVQAVFRGPRA